MEVMLLLKFELAQHIFPIWENVVSVSGFDFLLNVRVAFASRRL